MPFTPGMMQAFSPRTAQDYANQEADNMQKQQMRALQAQQMQQEMEMQPVLKGLAVQEAQAKIKNLQDEQLQRKQSMANEMLFRISQAEPEKRGELWQKARPMIGQIDPSREFPEQWDDSLATLNSPFSAKELMNYAKPDLPTGYRMNPSTGQAELIPGVDESYSRKADPYSMPMPVLLPNGQQGFATRRDVVNNPDAYKPPPSTDNAPFKRENTLRDEFNTLTKDFRTVQDAYSKIGNTSDSGAGDMSMLYAYVKLLDPGSVVRESEFATAAASGSYGERIQGAVKSVLEGGRLPPSQRKEFMSEAKRIYDGQKMGYDRTRKNYEGLAKNYGLDAKNIVTDYATQPSSEPVINTQADYDALPSGAIYMEADENGKLIKYRKP